MKMIVLMFFVLISCGTKTYIDIDYDDKWKCDVYTRKDYMKRIEGRGSESWELNNLDYIRVSIQRRGFSNNYPLSVLITLEEDGLFSSSKIVLNGSTTNFSGTVDLSHEY